MSYCLRQWNAKCSQYVPHSILAETCLPGHPMSSSLGPAAFWQFALWQPVYHPWLCAWKFCHPMVHNNLQGLTITSHGHVCLKLSLAVIDEEIDNRICSGSLASTSSRPALLAEWSSLQLQTSQHLARCRSKHSKALFALTSAKGSCTEAQVMQTPTRLLIHVIRLSCIFSLI